MKNITKVNGLFKLKKIMNKKTGAAVFGMLLAAASFSAGVGFNASLTAGSSIPLPVAKGGTGRTSFTADQVLVGNGGSAVKTSTLKTVNGASLFGSGNIIGSSTNRCAIGDIAQWNLIAIKLTSGGWSPFKIEFSASSENPYTVLWNRTSGDNTAFGDVGGIAALGGGNSVKYGIYQNGSLPGYVVLQMKNAARSAVVEVTSANPDGVTCQTQTNASGTINWYSE